MPATRTTGWPLDVALLLARVSLGAYFLLASISKFHMGHEAWMQAYAHAKPVWLPQWFATPHGTALPYLEATVGALLILGLLARLVGGVMTLMLISFTIVTGLMAPPLPFHHNGILLPLAFLLTVTGPGRIALDTLVFRPPGPKRGPAFRPQAGPGPTPK
jgi:uncharacterized membrane protein YphA (DoxX/SURF4 family)